jgi:hypothetical protein
LQRTIVARVVAIVISALLFAACGARSVPLQIQEVWFACDNDRQCTILEDPRCTLVPINSRYARSFADWVRLYRPAQVSPGHCPNGAFEYEPVCEANRCSSSLVRPP